MLIIGYGNRLRGGDAVGILAAEYLREILPAGSADILAVHQLTPELAEPVSRADAVLFLDAAADGVAGTIRECRVDAASAGAASNTHELSPAGLLETARILFGREPDATLITSSVVDFEYSLEPSPEVQRHARDLASAALRHL